MREHDTCSKRSKYRSMREEKTGSEGEVQITRTPPYYTKQKSSTNQSPVNAEPSSLEKMEKIYSYSPRNQPPLATRAWIPEFRGSPKYPSHQKPVPCLNWFQCQDGQKELHRSPRSTSGCQVCCDIIDMYAKRWEFVGIPRCC